MAGCCRKVRVVASGRCDAATGRAEGKCTPSRGEESERVGSASTRGAGDVMGDVCDSTSCAIMRCSKLRRLVEGSVEGEDLGGMAAKVLGGHGADWPWV